jgi:hypothetical protein
LVAQGDAGVWVLCNDPLQASVKQLKQHFADNCCAREKSILIIFAFTLSLDVRQLLANQTTLHLVYIGSSHMSLVTCHIHPVISPAHNAPKTNTKNFLDFDVGMGRLAEEVLPKPSYFCLPQVHCTVGGWISVFEDTIVTHKLHHTCHIMLVKSFIEFKDDADRRFQL